jgi:hypothetical protein
MRRESFAPTRIIAKALRVNIVITDQEGFSPRAFESRYAALINQLPKSSRTAARVRPSGELPLASGLPPELFTRAHRQAKSVAP